MKLGHVFLLFLVLVMMSSSANATTWGSGGYISSQDEGTINESQLYDALDTWLIENPAYGVVEDFMNLTDENTVTFRQMLRVGEGTNLAFERTNIRLGTTMSSSSSNRRFSNNYNDAEYGVITLPENCNIYSWNETSEEIVPYAADGTGQKSIYLYNITIPGGLVLESIYETHFYNCSNIDNLTVQNSFKGVAVWTTEDKIFSNISAYNITFTGYSLTNDINCTFTDYVFWNNETPYRYTAGVFPDGATGSNGLSVSGGSDHIITNLNINSSRWGGIYFSSAPDNIEIQNVTASWCAHNSIDIHGGTNSTIRDIWSYEAKSNGYLFSSSAVNNISLYDIYDYSPAASSFTVGDGASNIYAENFTIENEDGNEHDGIRLSDCTDVVLVNVSADGQCVTGFKVYDSGGTTEDSLFLYDSNVMNSTYLDIWSTGTNIYAVNSLFDEDNSAWNELGIYYYPNVVVVDGNSDPIENAVITINATSINGEGANVTSAITDSNGKLYDSGNRTNWIALLLNSTRNISASYNDLSDSNVTYVDSTWYSTNLSALNGTEIILTLDLSPITIDSYLPLIDPTSTEGDTQEFSVNLSKSANVTWYIDSVEVQTNTSVTSASYTNSTAPVGVYNVTVSVYDGSTYANQSWAWTVESPPITISNWEDHSVSIWTGTAALLIIGISLIALGFTMMVLRGQQVNMFNLVYLAIAVLVIVIVATLVQIIGSTFEL